MEQVRADQHPHTARYIHVQAVKTQLQLQFLRPLCFVQRVPAIRRLFLLNAGRQIVFAQSVTLSDIAPVPRPDLPICLHER